jgi:xylulokinase
MLADVFGKRAVILETQEGSAYGAALLAIVGTGAFGSVRDLCHEAIREVESIEPQAREARIYAEGHRTYQSLYPALSAFYQSQ